MSSANTNPFLGSYLNGGSSPEPESRSRNTAAQPVGEEFDDLFDYDPGIDDIFREVDTNMNAPTTAGKGSKSTGRKGAANMAGLGIDEEIQITRKKRVNVKLDQNRLLSQAGIPKLRRIAKERLRFKGKGHEYSDAARILSLYQLWLDDLYPKAKFADALTIVEKLGHSKRMQVMRKGWIEGTASRTTDENSESTNSHEVELNIHGLFNKSVNENVQGGGITAGVAAEGTLFGDGPQATCRQRAPPRVSDQGSSEDLYSSPKVKRSVNSALKSSGDGGDGLFFSEDEAQEENAAKGGQKDVVSAEDDMPGEDELDMLLNEGAVNAVSNNVVIKGDGATKVTVVASKAQGEEDFDDEMEAMMGMDNM
ncbi:hypothetical protein FGG08_004030 [Glutinoglossum americanum]|uniref:Chromosome segregation in meiosis protein n=1 Tax=Glutinoglossum americanum TaxID=1670608 RepID=A0A9P8I636_9PEZI|nr:hypothetical protein FGG08_004030 [Glutinoglossum americanum]